MNKKGQATREFFFVFGMVIMAAFIIFGIFVYYDIIDINLNSNSTNTTNQTEVCLGYLTDIQGTQSVTPTEMKSFIFFVLKEMTKDDENITQSDFNVRIEYNLTMMTIKSDPVEGYGNQTITHKFPCIKVVKTDKIPQTIYGGKE